MPSSIDALFEPVQSFKRPPIESWHPQTRVDLDLRIDAAGDWFYRGSMLRRRRLVKLFASILRRERDEYFLVTPAEKYPVAVEHEAFMAVEMRVSASPQTIAFRTNADDLVRVDAAHALSLRCDENLPVFPRVHVRAELYAKLTRAVFYELARYAVQQADARGWGVWSAGEFFPLHDEARAA